MSLFTDLCNTLDKRSLGGISEAVGEPETLVSRGMQTSIATVLGGMAAKSEDSGTLRKVLDLLPSGLGDVGWPGIASAATDPASPVMSAGRRMLSALFGGSESAVTQTLGNETGLPSGVSSSLLAMAAPMVMSFFTRKMRNEGLTIGGLGGLLQREIPALRTVLPAGLASLLFARDREREEVHATRPVVEQRTMVAERSSGRWILPLILLCLIPLFWWLFSRSHRVTMPTGTASRMAPAPMPAPLPAPAPTTTAPSAVNLYFDTASSRLRPDSQARLNQFVASVKGTPNVHIVVNGYTDNVGNADSNMRLSQSRADAVAHDIERSASISADNVSSKGNGEDNPVADNSTADGRAKNRRVTVGTE